MADNWMEDDGWLTDAERRRQPDPNRGQILPLRKTEDGVEFAWPQFMVDAYNAITLPRDTIQGYKPTAEDTTNFALNVAGGGVGTSAALKPEADLGMFLGRKAKNADTKKLSQAMSMASQGVPREEIWTQTGWWQKPDGEWAFEISDDGFQIDPHVMYELQNPEPEELITSNNPTNTGWESAETSTPEGHIWSNSPHKVVNHPEFWENYPTEKSLTPEQWDKMSSKEALEFMVGLPFGLQAKEIDLKLGEGTKYGGVYEHRAGRVRAAGSTPEQLKRVVIHELQHAVQSAEDWGGKGTNPEWTSYMQHKLIKKSPEGWSKLSKLDEELSYRQRLISTQKQSLTKADELEKIYPDYAKQPGNAITKRREEINKRIAEYEAEIDQIVEEAGEILSRPEIQHFNKIIGEYRSKFGGDPFQSYERNEGEMIANLTAKRMHMTESERALIPPWEDFGTPFSYDHVNKTLPEENQAWTDKDYNEFLQKWLQNPKGNLEDFNRDLKEAMNGKG